MEHKETSRNDNGEKIVVYTDGSVIKNGKKDSCCGWAYKIIRGGAEVVRSGSAIGKTNNQMEMTAVLEAMRAIPDKSCPVELCSDSQYVVRTLNWEYSVHKNEKLWDRIEEERERFSDIKFLWVKGHSKDQHNVDVDKAALAAAEERKNGGVSNDKT